MSVAVKSNRHQVVKMLVMLVIVAMSMLVFPGLMSVIMGVHFGQVDEDAQDHQDGACEHPQAADALAQYDGEQRTDKGRKRENRARASRTERALGQQVKTQTQAVPCGADQ